MEYSHSSQLSPSLLQAFLQYTLPVQKNDGNSVHIQYRFNVYQKLCNQAKDRQIESFGYIFIVRDESMKWVKKSKRYFRLQNLQNLKYNPQYESYQAKIQHKKEVFMIQHEAI